MFDFLGCNNEKDLEDICDNNKSKKNKGFSFFNFFKSDENEKKKKKEEERKRRREEEEKNNQKQEQEMKKMMANLYNSNCNSMPGYNFNNSGNSNNQPNTNYEFNFNDNSNLMFKNSQLSYPSSFGGSFPKYPNNNNNYQINKCNDEIIKKKIK